MDSPAAWQPDPTGKHEYRWWDGQRWTEHVADAGQASVDPMPADSPAPAQPADSSPPPASEQPGAAGTPADAGSMESGGGQPAGGGPQPGEQQAWGGQQPGQYQQQPAQQPAWGAQQPGQAGAWPQSGAQPPSGGGTDGFAIAALIFGILSLLVSWIPFVGLLGLFGGLIALVLGFVGRSRIKRRGGSGGGAAIAGIITGILAILVSLAVTIGTLFFFRSVEGGLGTFADFAECVEEIGDPEECERILEEGLPRWFFED